MSSDRLEIPVHETHVRADAERLGHRDQALAVDFPLLAFDLGVGNTHDQVKGLRTGGHDPGHGLDHVFQPLASIDESEGANHASARAVPAVPCGSRRVPGATSGTPCGITCTCSVGTW